MKKLFLLAFLFNASFAMAQMSYYDPTGHIDNDHIYFFTQDGCPHCAQAIDYIKQSYPNTKIEYLKIADLKNQDSFFACANKFGLNKRQLGTPLICMGQHYILGWSEDQEKQFDEFIKDFIEK